MDGSTNREWVCQQSGLDSNDSNVDLTPRIQHKLRSTVMAIYSLLTGHKWDYAFYKRCCMDVVHSLHLLIITGY